MSPTNIIFSRSSSNDEDSKNSISVTPIGSLQLNSGSD
jgi:hypothetical protein